MLVYYACHTWGPIFVSTCISHNTSDRMVNPFPNLSWCTVYPKKYAHSFCFAVLCCGYTLTDFPISIELTSLALWQSNDCPSASKATLMNMDKYFMWIHYERLRNHNKAKHNKTVCIFLGIYCMLVYYVCHTWGPSFDSTNGSIHYVHHCMGCDLTSVRKHQGLLLLVWFNLNPGPSFIKPDQLDPRIKDQLRNALLSTILSLQLPNFVDSRVIFIWSLILGSSWSCLIKVGPGMDK